MHFDVVVVGAGLGGLTSALYLANKGKRVAVVEKHHIPGGYATNFKRKGKNGKVYEFDVSLHGIGNLEKEGDRGRLCPAECSLFSIPFFRPYCNLRK